MRLLRRWQRRNSILVLICTKIICLVLGLSYFPKEAPPALHTFKNRFSILHCFKVSVACSEVRSVVLCWSMEWYCYFTTLNNVILYYPMVSLLYFLHLYRLTNWYIAVQSSEFFVTIHTLIVRWRACVLAQNATFARFELHASRADLWTQTSLIIFLQLNITCRLTFDILLMFLLLADYS